MSGETSSDFSLEQRYATPAVIPSTVICRIIRIPDDPVFIAAVNELLSRLGFEEVWDESGGGATAIECAAAGALMFDDYLPDVTCP